MTVDVKGTGLRSPSHHRSFLWRRYNTRHFPRFGILYYYWHWWCSDDDDDDDVPVDEGNIGDYDQSLPSYLTWWTCAASLWFRSRTVEAAVWANTIQWPASVQGTKHEQNIYLHYNHTAERNIQSCSPSLKDFILFHEGHNNWSLTDPGLDCWQ